MLLSFSGAQVNDTATGEKTDGGLTEGKKNDTAAINSADNATVNEEKPKTKKLPFSWKIMPIDTLLKSNDSAYLDCVAQAIGEMGAPPTYEWIAGSGEIIPIANASTDLNIWSFDNGTLAIKQFSDDLSGEYTCSVKSALKKTVTIRQGKPVTLGKLQDKAEQFIGCNLTIHCIASGDGTIKGSWLHGEEGKKIVPGGSKLVEEFKENNTYNLILHILEATAEDSNNYTCELTNEFDPSSEKKISVEFIENDQNKTCFKTKIVASSPHSTIEKEETEDDFVVVYIVPLVVVLALILIAVIISVAFVIRRRRLQQNAVFSGVKYRRTEGNDESARA